MRKLMRNNSFSTDISCFQLFFAFKPPLPTPQQKSSPPVPSRPPPDPSCETNVEAAPFVVTGVVVERAPPGAKGGAQRPAGSAPPSGRPIQQVSASEGPSPLCVCRVCVCVCVCALCVLCVATWPPDAGKGAALTRLWGRAHGQRIQAGTRAAKVLQASFVPFFLAPFYRADPLCHPFLKEKRLSERGFASAASLVEICVPNLLYWGESCGYSSPG